MPESRSGRSPERAGTWRRRQPVLESLESRRLLSTNIATFPLRAFGGYPQSVASGAGTDQNVWFTLAGNGGAIYYRDPLDTTVHGEYTIPTSDSGPGPIAAGPDGKYWFFEEAADQFGVIDPSTGKINEIPLLSTAGTTVMGITAGPNNTVWFTENNTSQIGMINTSTDEITEFPTTTPGSQPYGITQGPDGNIWFTESGANKVGMINVTTDVVTEFTIDASGNDEAEGITVGPGNNLWFTLTGAEQDRGNESARWFHGRRVWNEYRQRSACFDHLRVGQEPLVHRVGGQ